MRLAQRLLDSLWLAPLLALGTALSWLPLGKFRRRFPRA